MNAPSQDQDWCEQYFARDFAVMGRLVVRNDEGFMPRDLLIATVNPYLKDGAAVATDIASALNEKFTQETSNV